MPPTESFAIDSADFPLDPVATRFFSQPPLDHDDGPWPVLLSRTERRAMRVTFAMLGVFALALAGFLVYSRVIMPVPAELAADRAPITP